jgi:ubiquinone/menaquinone biosynthesis C-methylase UbiE
MTLAHHDIPKPWKGMGMEGRIARWYTKTRRNDMQDFRRQAQGVAARLNSGSHVLEVAPGPGFFSIELARLGDFRITGLDISHTFVEIASANAREANVKVDFRLGSASAMPFAAESFDLIYCSAAFKNFTEPVKALDEMHRVLRPGGEAVIVDLRKDASVKEINDYVDQSGRSRFDAWVTRQTFQHFLLPRAYTLEDFNRMVRMSRFGQCTVTTTGIGFEVRLRASVPAAEGRRTA